MQTATIPQLRQDLDLLPAQPNPDGSSAWLLHDPLSGRYFRLGQTEIELLGYIAQSSDIDTIATQASAALQQNIAASHVEKLCTFVRQHNLAVGDLQQQQLYQQQRNHKTGWFTHLAKSYLFIRIPLANPDRFISKTLPYIQWLGHPLTIFLFGVIFFAGLYLTLRQVDNFLATFIHFFSIEGAMLFGVSLILVKILHELGHAYVAKAYGCHVPVIGVALLVLWPVLYTDTSDAWRLTNRKSRLHIAVAGMAVELAVAALALLAWSLAPDGVIRSILFMLATTTWLVSLTINLNPLMRFDGYYLLSDLLAIPNLEQRSHALARWWLREKLFAIGVPPPELPHVRMILFAYAVWSYRFLLFISIALLVYFLFFKLLGIILLITEIGYFIIGPIYREIHAWYKMREQITLNPSTIRSISILLLLLGIVSIPWRGTIAVTAILQYQTQTIYTPLSGQIEQLVVRNGQQVEQGNTLLQLSAPNLQYEYQQGERHYQELQLQRSAASLNADMADQTLIIASELLSQNRNLRSLAAKLQRQRVVAPISGRVVNMATDLQNGIWLAEGEPLLTLVNQQQIELLAFLPEQDLGRIDIGKSGWFYPDGGGFDPVSVTVTEIESLGVQELSEPLVASLFGGDVAVQQNSDGVMLPVTATYRVHLVPQTAVITPQTTIRGTVQLDGEAESLLTRIYRRLMALLIRESSF